MNGGFTMKKLKVIFLCLILLFCLTACKSSKEDNCGDNGCIVYATISHCYILINFYNKQLN